MLDVLGEKNLVGSDVTLIGVLTQNLRRATETKLTSTRQTRHYVSLLNFGSDISKIQVLQLTAAANCVVKIVRTLNGSERGKE